MPTEKATVRRPWGYGNPTSRRSVSPGTSTSATRRRSVPRRSQSPGVTRRVKELSDTTSKTCFNTREVNSEQNLLESRVAELEAALAAEQQGAQKLFQTIAKLRNNQGSLKELTTASEIAQKGRESVVNTRNHFGAPTPTISAPATVTPPFEVPVKSIADPVPGASRALFVCTDTSKNESLYSLQATLLRNGFRSQRRVIVSAPDSHEHPTRSSIINGLKWLCDDAQPGDSLLFAFIGEGVSVTGVKDRTGGIAPADWASADIISELDLYSLLIQNLVTGVRLTCVFDIDKGLPGLSPSMFQNSLFCRGDAIMSDNISGSSGKVINADVTCVSYAFCPTQPEVGILCEGISDTFESLGLEMLLADFMMSVSKASFCPIQVSSTSDRFDQRSWFYLGILPTKKITTCVESQNPFLISSSTPVVTSRTPSKPEVHQPTTTSAMKSSVPLSHDVVSNTVKVLLLHDIRHPTASSMQTALYKFFTRHGLHCDIKSNDISWFLSDIQPGDATFVFEAFNNNDNNHREQIINSITKGSRLTWVQESNEDTTNLWYDAFQQKRLFSATYTTEDGMVVGPRNSDSPFSGGVVNIIVGPVDCTLTAFIGSLNRYLLHPTASQLLASMSVIVCDSVDMEDENFDFSLTLLSTRKLGHGTPMQVSVVPQSGFFTLDTSSAPPTPSMGSRPSPRFAVPINYNVTGRKSSSSQNILPETLPVVDLPEEPVADVPVEDEPPPPEVLKIIHNLPVDEPPPPPLTQPSTIHEAATERSFNEVPNIVDIPPNTIKSLPGRSYEDYVDLVTILLQQFDPGRINQIDQILDEYRGSEELMLEALAIQVGVPNYFTVRRNVLKYYEKVNPNKKIQVDSILGDYLNAWDELYQDLEERYGRPVLSDKDDVVERSTVSPQRNGNQPPIQADIPQKDFGNSTPNPRMVLFSEGNSLVVPQVSIQGPPTVESSPIVTSQLLAPQVRSASPSVGLHTIPIPSESTSYVPSSTDSELLQKRSDAEQRYQQLKEQTDSFRKRVEALKERGSSPTNPLGISDINFPTDIESLARSHSVNTHDKQLENTWLHWVEPAVTSSRLM